MSEMLTKIGVVAKAWADYSDDELTSERREAFESAGRKLLTQMSEDGGGEVTVPLLFGLATGVALAGSIEAALVEDNLMATMAEVSAGYPPARVQVTYIVGAACWLWLDGS